MPQSQVAANPWHIEEAEWDANQHAQNNHTHEKLTDQLSLPQASDAKRMEKHKDKTQVKT